MHRKTEEIRCPVCGKKFPNERSLVHHERGKHKKKKYDKRPK